MQECQDKLTCKVLAKAANTKCIKNAERDLHLLLRRHGMTVPLVPTILSFGNQPGGLKVELPCITLKSWFEYLLSTHPKFVLGGFPLGSDAGLLLETFWENFEKAYPDHKIFEMFDHNTRRHCIPFYLHMDEGVGQRKKAVLCISAQTIFGAETATRYATAYDTGCVRSMDDAARCMTDAQFQSSKGSTYKTRFLYTAIPKKNYSHKREFVFHGVLNSLADECFRFGGRRSSNGWDHVLPSLLGVEGRCPGPR